jgi:tRNA threonylcarbamoyladenosine biosynthesis protein TsaB
MTWLALDTSTDTAYVALKHQGQIFQRQLQGVASHAQSILPMIEAIFQEAQIDLCDVNGIIVGRGPGSFTGLRVACAVAKGLALVHQIPIYPVSSMMAMAWQAKVLPTLAIMDARMQQVYWAYYSNFDEKPAEHVTCLSEVNIDSNPAMLVTYQIEAYNDKMPQQFSACKRYEASPNAVVMIEIVEANLISAIDASLLEPHYVRNQVTQGGKNG